MSSFRHLSITSAVMICLIVSIAFLTLETNCTGKSSGKSDLRQGTPTSNPPATVALNGEPMGATDDLSQLGNSLKETFKNRVTNYVIKKGMERRTDLLTEQRIEKTVFVKALPSIRLDELRRVVEVVSDAGATPVLFPITVAQRKARIIEPRRIRLCTVCAISDRGDDGESKPNPVMLLVRLLSPKSDSQEIKSVPFSLDEFLIADGVPFILSRSATTQSAIVITIGKTGDYSSGDKRITKAELRREIENRLRSGPSSEKVLFVKAVSDINYSELEDLYYEAFAAGVNEIYLDTGEQTFSWADQEITVNIPAGWKKRHEEKNEFSFEGPDNGRLKIEVVTSSSGMQPEQALESDHSVALGLQREGTVDEVQYLLVDGVKGTLSRRNAKPGRPISFQWVGYRTWKGKQQFISILMEISPNTLVDRQQELMNILQSVRFAAGKN